MHLVVFVAGVMESEVKSLEDTAFTRRFCQELLCLAVATYKVGLVFKSKTYQLFLPELLKNYS